MGILDDAIREHLELKRAHGASDDELRRQEAEAFGPVRQEVVVQPAEDDATQMLAPADADAEAVEAHAPPAEGELEPAQPAAEDPYAVHPGDTPVPDPHDHAHPAGSDPAWGEDTEFFSEQPAAAPEPQPHEQAQHDHDEPHPALHDHEAFHAEEHPPEPAWRPASAAPAAPEAPIGPAPVEEPPVEEPPVEEPPARAPDEDEDVLEETPEFLQDAPEHDRLWFEQKPPRDFDFGE